MELRVFVRFDLILALEKIIIVVLTFLTYSCLLYEFNLPVILPYYMLKGYTVIDTS
jgi:hypothetical protein